MNWKLFVVDLPDLLRTHHFRNVFSASSENRVSFECACSRLQIETFPGSCCITFMIGCHFKTFTFHSPCLVDATIVNIKFWWV